MKTLLCGGMIVDVTNDTIRKADVLLDGDRIAAVGEPGTITAGPDASTTDVSGLVLAPGFIDGHIHIESTLMLPPELARIAALHGTSALVADPHEIANVCGMTGIRFMLNISRGLPIDMLYAASSCVPASPFDESGATLTANDLRPLYDDDQVVALAEVMDYPGVLAGNPDLLRKIADARAAGRVVNGHAPGLLGDDLKRYIAAGINDDHESSTFEEGRQRVEDGIWCMIREGSAARNLEALMGLFAPEYNERCLLVTDDKHADDLLENGHIDHIIRKAISLGANPLVAIRMATIQAARCFNLPHTGAILPGYTANLVAMDSLENIQIRHVWHQGQWVVRDGALTSSASTACDRADELARAQMGAVTGTFHLDQLQPGDFHAQAEGRQLCPVIGVVPGELVTEYLNLDLDFSTNNGVDIARDIAKIAVCERHHHTGHRGLGFIRGLGLKTGAVASSVSHDSHNLIVVGVDEADMALAANTVIAQDGGRAVVRGGEVLATQALPIAGLMSAKPAQEVARESTAIDEAIQRLGCAPGIDPVMNMAFCSLTVIPHLKMTTHGPFDVDKQQVIPLVSG